LESRRSPTTQMRSPLIAGEPSPSPRLAIDHARCGPDAGHCLISPVSLDTPLRSGPRHCGQSDGPLGTEFEAAGEIAASENDAWTEKQMMNRTAGRAGERERKRKSVLLKSPLFHKQTFVQ